MGSQVAVKPHALCIPFTAQGHINPMMQLARILHSKGFYITFVNSEFNQDLITEANGHVPATGFDDFRLETIPDGLPLSHGRTTNVLELCESTRKNMKAPFGELMTRLKCSPGVPGVTCVIADGVLNFTQEVAEEFGVPRVTFWTTSACGYWGYLQIPELIERGYTPLKDLSCLAEGYLETILDWFPGMPNVYLKDMTAFTRTTDPDDFLLNYTKTESQMALRTSALILNTFDDLEKDVVEAMRSRIPCLLYTIGPLLTFSEHESKEEDKSIPTTLLKEETECLTWLDKQQFKSVLYGRGLIANWCDQEHVLSHASVGGFLTHSGWNSMLEAICNGVLVICWPFFAEQHTNCRYACIEWGFGMEIDNNVNVKRDTVEAELRELMEGMKGTELRAKIMKWKQVAEKAIKPRGSSYENLDALVKEVLLKNYENN
ncbi:hypothetical protein AMTRI_Chr04g182360 [Amborella trichopoda]